MAQSEVFEDEILSRPENTDNPTDEMPEQRDHGKNITRTSSIEPLANLLILRLQNVLTMDNGKSPARCGGKGSSSSCRWSARRATC
jgi:hypothetical protein